MFSDKKQNKNRNIFLNKVEADEPSALKLITTPQICLFDFEENIENALTKQGFNIRSCSLGTVIAMPSSSRTCLSNHEWPQNLHEYDIFMFDMQNKELDQYSEVEHEHHLTNSDSVNYFLVKPPQTVFDPRAVAGSEFRRELSQTKTQTHVLIAFASTRDLVKYAPVSQTGSGMYYGHDFTQSNYSFVNRSHHNKNICGSKIKIVARHNELRNLLEYVGSQFSYEVTFTHPCDHYRDMDDGTSKLIPNDTFVPLMTNVNDEIVSYIDIQDNCLVIMFPQIVAKEKILIPLLKEIRPSIVPELFPESTRFAWKNEVDYWLPNHEILLDKRTEIEKEYADKLKHVNDEIDVNMGKYSFLHDMLTCTDDELVDVVIMYLDWLGYNTVKKMDGGKILKEEDIQIDLGDGLLVIEVKGIGGTSKDEDCNQIYKIRNRRCEERNKFDVSALYIVNHQRHLPPKKRRNPPFTPEQIKDANNDKRGLLTTWELYQAYFWINSGLVTKENVRKKMLGTGCISLTPDMDFIGQANEVYQNGTIIILSLIDVKINKGDALIAESNGKLQQIIVLNIRVNDKDIDEVSSGEVGLLLDSTVKSKANIYRPNMATGNIK